MDRYDLILRKSKEIYQDSTIAGGRGIPPKPKQSSKEETSIKNETM